MHHVAITYPSWTSGYSLLLISLVSCHVHLHRRGSTIDGPIAWHVPAATTSWTVELRIQQLTVQNGWFFHTKSNQFSPIKQRKLNRSKIEIYPETTMEFNLWDLGLKTQFQTWNLLDLQNFHPKQPHMFFCLFISNQIMKTNIINTPTLKACFDWKYVALSPAVPIQLPMETGNCAHQNWKIVMNIFWI